MSVANYLLQRQPLVTKTFSYGLNHDQLAHSYLLFGEPGTPLKETALYLAKSILCDHPHPLADEECVTCKRIDSREYPDFVFLDGEDDSIKKDDVLQTVSLFQKTPLERKGITVYVIHLVENMTLEAINALLKFLEEPNDYTYAILTTQNEDKVLSTIVSRCEKLRLILTPRSEVFADALALGVAREDIELLAFFHNDAASLQRTAKEESYQKIKEALIAFVDALGQSPRRARYMMEKEVTPLLKTKPDARFFFDLLTVCYRDIVALKTGNPIALSSYDTILRGAKDKVPHPESSLETIMTLRGEIELNIKIGLITAHLVNVLTKE